MKGPQHRGGTSPVWNLWGGGGGGGVCAPSNMELISETSLQSQHLQGYTEVNTLLDYYRELAT